MEVIEQQLRDETEKWLEKINKERKIVNANDEKGADLLKNVDAYIEDTQHFLEKNDLIRAFEAVVWAWSWLEIGKELGIFRTGQHS